MESSLQKSPKLRPGGDISDAKSVSGLSTILVATIQEAKDRISQVEYVFCSQLYPKVKLNYQSIQEKYSAAKEAAETEYKKKEENLLLEINNLHLEKQEVLDENKLLKLENMKFISMEKMARNRVHELYQELRQKNTELNDVRELHQNLQNLLESKSSDLSSYEKAMKELEEKNRVLTNMQKKLEVETGELQLELKKKSNEVNDEKESKSNELRNMETKVNELLSELRGKTEEVCKGKELHENLLKKIEFQASEMMSIEQLLNQHGKENKLLAAELQSLRSRADELEKELGNKPAEPQEKRKAQQLLFRQSDSFCSERIKRDPALNEFEEERKQLLEKHKNLQEKVDMLQECLSERTKESSLQIEAKDSELQSEKSKIRGLITSYKRLKSQYNYLLKKFGLTEETMLSEPFDKMENGNEIIMQSQTSLTPFDENHASKAHGIAINGMKPTDKAESSDGKKRAVSVRRSSPASPSASTVVAPKCTGSTKLHPSAGSKRRNSYWRDTRSHHSRVGPDPHDDFLDTPLENTRGKLGKIMREDLPELAPTNISLDNSDDDETQDMNPDAGPQKLHTYPPKAGTSGFKYVEPVRKKAERENLKGIECKQCKKFYDAVLPGAGNDKNVRCEHHDGVSRHRYKYAPPMTPEGFWNIGFESEM